MDPKLHRLVKDLKKISCPDSVQRRVDARIRENEPSGIPTYWKVAAVFSLILTAILVFRMDRLPKLSEGDQNIAQVEKISDQPAELSQAERDTLLALSYFGSVILDSTSKVEQRLLPKQKDNLFSNIYLPMRNQLLTNKE